MDRGGTNLEALAEEEDEESWESEEEEEFEEQGDGGVKKGEPNKFDSLCDGVQTHMSLVHNALGELLELKDELLKHALPPNVLTKIALCTTKVYRAESDLHMPVNELLRLVRIYSTPWEEKSAALKKLHDDYESKKSQLSIAVKRLQLVDAHSKRMAHEKRIMNWEKLFCKLTTAKGHGRRWKFLIDAFKKKAGQGIESLQQYLNTMDQAGDSDSDNEEEMKEIETQMQQLAPSESAQTDQLTSEEESEEDAETESDNKLDMESELEKVSEPVVPTYIRPPMKDQKVWTHEPEFGRSLHVRVYKPEGLPYRELRCVLSCGIQVHKTAALDMPDVESEEETESEASVDPHPPGNVQDEKRPLRGRGRGLIGLRGTRGSAITSRPGAARADGPQGEKKSSDPNKQRFEECVFMMPDDKPQGIWDPDRRKAVQPEHIQIAVHFGPKDEMVAMATIDMDDLDSLDLPSLYLPTPNDGNEHALMLYRMSEAYESGSQASSHPEEEISKLDPLNFPLYSVHAGKSDAIHRPCGQLPLLCFWAKTLRPTSFHKNTESQSVHEVIMEETGFDMTMFTKEDLHPDLVERCISAASFASSGPKEETVPRVEYDRLMNIHREEMELLQEEYETRLQELAESLQEIQTSQLAVPRSKSPQVTVRSKSPRPQSVSSPTEETQNPQSDGKMVTQQRAKRRESTKSFKVSRPLPNWGESLPANFFDRLRLFEEKSQLHMREITEKQGRETSELIQKKLASEYKLNPEDADDDMMDAMQDVSLPAVFLPTKSRDLSIFNPRAHQYFHASGTSGARLTQPPSMVQLPPLPKSRMSVVNLFDLSQNFKGGGRDVMLEQYLQQQQQQHQQGSRPVSGTVLSEGRSTLTSAYQSPAPRPMPSRDASMMAMTTGPYAQREAMLD